ncbi:mannitol dehydrogenase family protein [Microlunatus sp. Gsoil 973]|uniref:mannitol dehydrogenase family protein n=1 Tax=Microlunatus sp. Gsoil 973 TaxID=2672569 RepID=UPI0012B4ACA6|nr:mannitol dehydrogenase family protein [Microlunatus sp. Gsoil 973]QGN34540.1 mannitol dehydrogenase family protein [Microlunatus sp. Gsoil 973]
MSEVTDAVRPRTIHLGLGAFFRAHQAFYTHHADQLTGEPTGIHAFTGRRPDAAQALAAQGFGYTLIERGAAGDRLELITSIRNASAGADLDAWRSAWREPELQLITLTITEAGYRVTQDDLGALQAERPGSAMARLLDGLQTRRRAGLPPIAVVSCDNLAGNGGVLSGRVADLAARWDPELADWIAAGVSFPSTMVDRITPATTDADRDQATAWIASRPGGQTVDRMPVVCEPFTEWVIAGDFPAGRPAWDRVGVAFVEDVEPYERRKLWLLNAGHSMLAYVGLALGRTTIDQAMTDPRCTDLLEALWAAAAQVLPFEQAEIDKATAALRDRFTNPRIRHNLAQIASDGSQKLPNRTLGIYRARRSAGLPLDPGTPATLAGWLIHLGTDLVNDQGVAELRAKFDRAGASDPSAQVPIMLDHFGRDLADDHELAAAVHDQLKQLADR